MPEPAIRIDDWIARFSIPFTLDSPSSFHSAVDQVLSSFGSSVEILGIGEPLHGGEDFLILRNRLFQRLVEAHGYRAIAIESSYVRSRRVNAYVNGEGTSYDDVRDAGFSNKFGELESTRELVEWMREYNADEAHPTKLRFYGFDAPMVMMYADAPRHLLQFVLDYLDEVAASAGFRSRIEPLFGPDSGWEDPAAAFDPSKSVGLSASAASLRVAVEDVISHLACRRPEFARRDGERFAEVLHWAIAARQLLNYHAGMAGSSPTRVADLLGIRDASMADNLEHILSRERPRGKVLAFAHNSHLKCGRAHWQLGPQLLEWWPAGAHLRERLGLAYRVIGTGLGTSEANGIGVPEPGTLEARLVAGSGTGRFIPVKNVDPAEAAALPVRSGSQKNHSYFPLKAESLTEFDALAVLNTSRYSRGAPPLP